MAEVKARLKLRQGPADTWAGLNPVLLIGELGFETDTKRLRIGDGVTAFSALPAFETRLPEWGDISGTPAAFPPAAHTHLASGISDSSVIGQDLLKAPDLTAIWTLLYLGALAGKTKISVPGDINASGTPDGTTFLAGDGHWRGMLGWSQVWTSVTRTPNTVYQNTTNRPIMIAISGTGNFTALWAGGVNPPSMRIAYNNASGSGTNEQYHISAIIPPDYYYELRGNYGDVLELR